MLLQMAHNALISLKKKKQAQKNSVYNMTVFLLNNYVFICIVQKPEITAQITPKMVTSEQ